MQSNNLHLFGDDDAEMEQGGQLDLSFEENEMMEIDTNTNST